MCVLLADSSSTEYLLLSVIGATVVRKAGEYWPYVRERANEQWLMELRGPNPDGALADLYNLLVRGLRAALGGYGGGVEANFGDFAQGALIKITGNLDSFRGEPFHNLGSEDRHERCPHRAQAQALARRLIAGASRPARGGRPRAGGRPAKSRTAGASEHCAAGVTPHGQRRTDRQATRGGRGGVAGGDARLGGGNAHGHQPERPLQAAPRRPQKAKEADGGRGHLATRSTGCI